MGPRALTYIFILVLIAVNNSVLDFEKEIKAAESHCQKGNLARQAALDHSDPSASWTPPTSSWPTSLCRQAVPGKDQISCPAEARDGEANFLEMYTMLEHCKEGCRLLLQMWSGLVPSCRSNLCWTCQCIWTESLDVARTALMGHQSNLEPELAKPRSSSSQPSQQSGEPASQCQQPPTTQAKTWKRERERFACKGCRQRKR